MSTADKNRNLLSSRLIPIEMIGKGSFWQSQIFSGSLLCSAAAEIWINSNLWPNKVLQYNAVFSIAFWQRYREQLVLLHPYKPSFVIWK